MRQNGMVLTVIIFQVYQQELLFMPVSWMHHITRIPQLRSQSLPLFSFKIDYRSFETGLSCNAYLRIYKSYELIVLGTSVTYFILFGCDEKNQLHRTVDTRSFMFYYIGSLVIFCWYNLYYPSSSSTQETLNKSAHNIFPSIKHLNRNNPLLKVSVTSTHCDGIITLKKSPE